MVLLICVVGAAGAIWGLLGLYGGVLRGLRGLRGGARWEAVCSHGAARNGGATGEVGHRRGVYGSGRAALPVLGDWLTHQRPSMYAPYGCDRHRLEQVPRRGENQVDGPGAGGLPPPARLEELARDAAGPRPAAEADDGRLPNGQIATANMWPWGF